MENYSRNVNLYCQICGDDQFEFDSENENTTYKCFNCGKEYTREELISVNQEIINSNIEDVQREVLSEIEKEFKKMF